VYIAEVLMLHTADNKPYLINAKYFPNAVTGDSLNRGRRQNTPPNGTPAAGRLSRNAALENGRLNQIRIPARPQPGYRPTGHWYRESA
jgi:hypothetical protein